ncbi:bifunctional p-450:nadph-p450 reductase protein [Pyrenophora tritici-repentis]|nr:bifunctional p-450:nadph-p450 reductase protein [Pyrenophora tritici-repentis]
MSTESSGTRYVLTPGPPGHRFFSNLWGPIWKFHVGNEERIVIRSQALLDEVCDEARFVKVIAANLKQARNGVEDGLGMLKDSIQQKCRFYLY